MSSPPPPRTDPADPRTAAAPSSLPHVLWIGGPSGSGKTTVARRLARRHGLRHYAADVHTWAHRDRALAAGHPAAHRFESLTRAERIAAPFPERLAMSLHRERGPMAVDDLRALPPSPLTVADGTLVVPGMVPSGDLVRAVWLTVTPETQRRRLAARHGDGSVPGLYLWMREVLEEEIAEGGEAAVRLPVDGLSEEEVLTEVERLFAEPLAAGPLARTRAERRELARYDNRTVVEQHRAFYARPWAADVPRTKVVPFACECGAADCEATVRLPVLDHPSAAPDGSSPLLAPGHA